MNYDDETEETVPCLEEPGTVCRHIECLRRSPGFCGHQGRPEAWTGGVRTCLLVGGHGGMWHQGDSPDIKWSTCRRHPGCDCPRHDKAPAIETPKPHVCPEPTVLFVNIELVENVQKFIDELKGYQLPGQSPYETLRLIIGEMEKGFRVP